MYVCMYVCMYVRMYVCMYIYIYIHISCIAEGFEKALRISPRLGALIPATAIASGQFLVGEAGVGVDAPQP